MDRLTGATMDIVKENIEQLKRIFPDVFTEGKVDFDKLRQVLGEYVEESAENYSFTWSGKAQAKRLAQTPTTGTLRPCKEDSKDWDSTKNLYIEGDNLEVLKLLQKSYFGKVKMIYIDPPYNTGKDFVYKDNFHDSIQNYKKITGQVDDEGKRVSTNTESDGRYHTNWLNMMYPRLRLARNLLTEDGVIFISIDDKEVANLRKICDEIFGEDNFLGIITWNKKRKGSFLSKGIISITEYLIVYNKNKQISVGIYGGKADENESQPIIKRTNKKTMLNIPAQVVCTKLEDGLYGKGNYGDEINPVELLDDITVENGVIINSFRLKAPFVWTQDKFNEQLAKGAKFIINTLNLQLRVYKILDENEFKGFGSYISGVEIQGTNEDAYEDLEDIFKIKKIFDYSKPINYLKSIINASTFFDTNSIILDFFSGSAATAHAVMQLNAEDGGKRQYIMVQLPELTEESSEAYKAGYKNICEIGKERIRRAGEKIKEEKGMLAEDLDIGFKVFKLDSSNILEWVPPSDNKDVEALKQKLIGMGQVIVTNRTHLDVVYEIMLKMGLDLTYPVEELTFADKKVYSVGAGALMICLADSVPLEIAEEMLKYEDINPELTRIVFSDKSFKDDSTKLSVKERFTQAGFDKTAFMTI